MKVHERVLLYTIAGVVFVGMGSQFVALQIVCTVFGLGHVGYALFLAYKAINS